MDLFLSLGSKTVIANSTIFTSIFPVRIELVPNFKYFFKIDYSFEHSSSDIDNIDVRVIVLDLNFRIFKVIHFEASKGVENFEIEGLYKPCYFLVQMRTKSLGSAICNKLDIKMNVEESV